MSRSSSLGFADSGGKSFACSSGGSYGLCGSKKWIQAKKGLSGFFALPFAAPSFGR